MQDPNISARLSHAAHHFRFHAPHAHLSSLFGNDVFALRAERFARFFGTPGYLVGQTALVVLWVAANVVGVTHFDIYPFILLNLAFSLQAAYAAPLILLAQTRQADRDKVHADADARHREALAEANLQRQEAFASQSSMMLELLQRSTELTQATQELTARINTLTDQIHRRVVAP
jgi:uncharacterized membrane protein